MNSSRLRRPFVRRQTQKDIFPLACDRVPIEFLDVGAGGAAHASSHVGPGKQIFEVNKKLVIRSTQQSRLLMQDGLGPVIRARDYWKATGSGFRNHLGRTLP